MDLLRYVKVTSLVYIVIIFHRKITKVYLRFLYTSIIVNYYVKATLWRSII